MQSATKPPHSPEVEVLNTQQKRENDLNSLGFQKTGRLFHNSMVAFHFGSLSVGHFLLLFVYDYSYSVGAHLSLSREGKSCFVVGCIASETQGWGVCVSGEVPEAHTHCTAG